MNVLKNSTAVDNECAMQLPDSANWLGSAVAQETLQTGKPNGGSRDLCNPAALELESLVSRQVRVRDASKGKTVL